MTAERVASFIGGFAETVEKMTVVVIDNASIHRAKAVTEQGNRMKELPDFY